MTTTQGKNSVVGPGRNWCKAGAGVCQGFALVYIMHWSAQRDSGA